MDIKEIKIKGATIARIIALIVALVNQGLALFGKDLLPFTDNWVYQAVSLFITIVVAAVNCWYNNDITVTARLIGKVVDALRDGDLTEQEIAEIIEFADSEEIDVVDDSNRSFLILFANNLIKKLKEKMDDKKEQKVKELTQAEETVEPVKEEVEVPVKQKRGRKVKEEAK